MNGRTPSPAQAAYLALMDDRDRWRETARQAALRGYERGAAEAGGITSADLADARAEGRRSARRDLAAFDEGWAACLERFAELIGGRVDPGEPTEAEITRWTRHAPRCRHGGRGGSQSCQRSGCIPGGREHYGEPAPWERPLDRAAIRASWDLPKPDGRLYVGGPPVHHHKCGKVCRSFEPGWYTRPEARAILRKIRDRAS